MFLRESTGEAARVVPRAPGAGDDATVVMPSAAPPPATPHTPRAGAPGCSGCGYRNEPGRIRCERCGMELRSAWPAPVVPPPPTPTTFRPRRSRTWLGALLAVLVLTVLATGSYLLFRPSSGQKADSDSTDKTTAGGVPVEPGEVSVTASSVSRDRRFPATNLLDGDRKTMWQTDGARLDGNVGTTLTFRFAEPVELVRIIVVNGAAVTRKAYEGNQRLKRVMVTTDTAEKHWDLSDAAGPQSLALSPAVTSSVTLTVERTYPGLRFRDLAVTDVGFERRP
jgi:hypothetical protein